MSFEIKKRVRNVTLANKKRKNTCFVEVQERLFKERKNMLESRKKLADEKVEEIKKSCDKAEQEYYRTKDEMPKGWDIVGMQVKPRFVRHLNSDCIS